MLAFNGIICMKITKMVSKSLPLLAGSILSGSPVARASMDNKWTTPTTASIVAKIRNPGSPFCSTINKSEVIKPKIYRKAIDEYNSILTDLLLERGREFLGRT